MQTNNENRAHYRINDTIDFHYCILPTDSAEHVDDHYLQQALFPDQQSWQRFQLAAQFQEMEQKFHEEFIALQRTQPSISNILANMNKKIDVLIDHLLPYPASDKQKVNLSIGGIAFFAAESIQIGTRLAMRIHLTSYANLILYAQVVYYSDPHPLSKSGLYRIATRFEAVTEQQEQTLSQYIIQRQAEHAKLRRGFDEQKAFWAANRPNAENG